MSRASAYKQIMYEYDENRRNAKRLLEVRKQETYEKLPEINDIDNELVRISLKLVKTAASVGDMNAVEVKKLKERSQTLREQKKSILVKNNYSAEYFNDIYKCGICQDTGYIGTAKCDCLKQRLIEKYYDMSNVREAVKAENFDTFDFRLYSDETIEGTGYSPRQSIQMIYSVCNQFVNNFDKSFLNLIFYGETGLGKTFLCNCIAKDLLERCKPVLYVTAPQIFKKIEDYRFHRDELENADEQMDFIYEVDLLIVDDLGSEFSTIVTNTALFDIINTRLINKKHTIISTNLSIQELQNTYSDRIVSRFLGNYKLLRLVGEDIRLIKKHSKAFSQ